MSKKSNRKTYADLQRENQQLLAQLAHVYHFAGHDLRALAKTNYIGSAVIIQIHAIGGKEVLRPVAIRDGLSLETVEALRKDVARSYELAVMFKPLDDLK